MHYNDVTGNALVTKPASDQYRTGWDAIFGKKESKEVPVEPTEVKAEALQALVDQAQELKLGY